MNQDSDPELSATYEETSMLQKKPPLDPKERDKRAAKVLWYILMALRFIIPAYMLYVVYLYWTVPFAPYLQGPR
jgi:hypothetical protein